MEGVQTTPEYFLTAKLTFRAFVIGRCASLYIYQCIEFTPDAGNMLAILAILSALAGIQAQHTTAANANLPISSNGSAVFQSQISNGSWTVANSSVNLANGPIGWRIEGNAASEVLYNVSSACI